MKMASSSSRTSAFESILEHLDWLLKRGPKLDGVVRFEVWEMCREVRVLLTFDLYVTNCRRKQEMCWEHDLAEKGNNKSLSLRLGIILSKIQDLGEITYIQSGASNLNDITTELNRFKENIWLFFETEIRPSCIISLLHHYSLGDPRLDTNLTDSVLNNLEWLTCLNYGFDNALRIVMRTLQAKLLFLQSFICFATVQGVEGKGLIDLLIHAEVVAVKAARLIEMLV